MNLDLYLALDPMTLIRNRDQDVLYRYLIIIEKFAHKNEVNCGLRHTKIKSPNRTDNIQTDTQTDRQL